MGLLVLVLHDPWGFLLANSDVIVSICLRQGGCVHSFKFDQALVIVTCPKQAILINCNTCFCYEIADPFSSKQF